MSLFEVDVLHSTLLLPSIRGVLQDGCDLKAQRMPPLRPLRAGGIGSAGEGLATLTVEFTKQDVPKIAATYT